MAQHLNPGGALGNGYSGLLKLSFALDVDAVTLGAEAERQIDPILRLILKPEPLPQRRQARRDLLTGGQFIDG